LKQALWNPQTQWFDFINGNGQPETRWTVQIIYLYGSAVLDTAEEVSPRPAAYAPHTALRGVKIRDAVFDIELGDKEYKVLSGGKTIVAPMGSTVSIKKNVMSISKETSKHL